MPNIETNTGLINAKRFLLRPETHFNQVYEISTVSCFFKTSQSCFFLNLAWRLHFIHFWFLKAFLLNKYLRFIDLTKQPQPSPPPTSSRSKASAPTVNLKLGRSRPKAVAFEDIQNIDPKIDLEHQPKNDLETWALGTVYKLVHQAVNKCVSNATIIDYYQYSIGVVKDYHSLLKTSGQQEFKSLPQPPELG